MTNSGERTKHGRTVGWLAAIGVAVLVAFAVVPTLSGVASATPALTVAAASGSEQWAYGGEGWSNSTLVLGNATATWDAAFGWTVIFTATNTTPGTLMIEEQRTVGITVTATYTGPIVQASYSYHGQESDLAFANLTNQATVYSNGTALPALGIENESTHVQGAIAEQISVTASGHTRSASLTVNGIANVSIAFAPALGILPLNLTGVNAWNSSATVSGLADWNLGYAWTEHGYNGTVGQGSGSVNGSWSAAGPVNLQGFKVHVAPAFADHTARTAIVLIVEGPFDTHDGFVLVPHDFDLFGNVGHSYDSMSFGSASIASGETLFLSSGVRGPSVTAASSTFGANDQAVNAQAAPISGPSPAASAGPSATVTGAPMSVVQAQAESNCLTNGCSAAGAASSGLLLVALVGLVAVAVVSTVGVVEWRSYARRRSEKGLVGGYGESWTNGVPPAGAVLPLTQPPTPPTEGPASPGEPRGPA